MGKTKISWATDTWSPVVGCSKVSEGCRFCYGERIAKRFKWDFSKVTLHPERLEQPLHWRKPRRVFVCSMGDLFHADVPDEFIASAMAVMELARWHTFQVLTKRPDRMRRLFNSERFHVKILAFAQHWMGRIIDMRCEDWFAIADARHYAAWPIDHVWLGVSAENQKAADERLPLLMETPAAKRFVSCEPLLGTLDLTCVGGPFNNADALRGWVPVDHGQFEKRLPSLDLVIVAGESGGPPERRLVERCETASGIPYHRLNIEGEPPERAGRVHKPCGGTGWRPKPEALEWMRHIRDQCVAAGVPFHFKGWGGPTPYSGGHLIDGKEWREVPM